MEIHIRHGKNMDKAELLELYREVAKMPDGIIRQPEEINKDYISHFLEPALTNGLILIAIGEGKIVGEIHAVTPPLFAFQHMLTDLTIVVAPSAQGLGIGRKLFEQFLDIVKSDYPTILRVELFTREHNVKNVKFYESLGFVNEGRQERKIFVSENSFHTPLHMAWFNPNYGGAKN